jgi:hypothetical protein
MLSSYFYLHYPNCRLRSIKDRKNFGAQDSDLGNNPKAHVWNFRQFICAQLLLKGAA